MASDYFREYLSGPGPAPVADRLGHVRSRRRRRHAEQPRRRARRRATDSPWTRAPRRSPTGRRRMPCWSRPAVPPTLPPTIRSSSWSTRRITRWSRPASWDTFGMRGTCSPGFNLRAQGDVAADPAGAVRGHRHADHGSRTRTFSGAPCWIGIAKGAVGQSPRASCARRRAESPASSRRPRCGWPKSLSALQAMEQSVHASCAEYERLAGVARTRRGAVDGRLRPPHEQSESLRFAAGRRRS